MPVYDQREDFYAAQKAGHFGGVLETQNACLWCRRLTCVCAIKQSPPQVPTTQTGWQCPACGTCHAPWVARCDGCKPGVMRPAG